MHIAKLITAALMITTAATTASPGLATTVPIQEARTSTVTLEPTALDPPDLLLTPFPYDRT